jgi:hypothetical protein
MPMNPRFVRLGTVALGLLLGASMGTLAGCGSSELGTIKVPADLRRKPSTPVGPGTTGKGRPSPVATPRPTR